jgi:hypothetical protein
MRLFDYLIRVAITVSLFCLTRMATDVRHFPPFKFTITACAKYPPCTEQSSGGRRINHTLSIGGCSHRYMYFIYAVYSQKILKKLRVYGVYSHGIYEKRIKCGSFETLMTEKNFKKPVVQMVLELISKNFKTAIEC